MYLLLAGVITAALGSSQVALEPTRPARCAVENQPAHIVENVIPEYPQVARLNALSGKALIRVDISDSGRVVSTSVRESSGNFILDRSALRAVKSMVFAPETQSCKAVGGSYGVEVDFPIE